MKKKIAGFPNYSISFEGNICNDNTGNKINLTLNKSNGYYTVKLYDANNKAKNPYFHRIYAIAWIPNIENYKIVNHKNAIKTDNSIDNLEWCTQRHNMIEAGKLGLMGGRSLLDDVQVKTIKACIKDGISNMELSEYFKVHNSIISNIKTGKTYNRICLQS